MFQMVTAAASIAVALTVLLGWMTGTDTMTRVFFNSIAVNPMTAICLIALSTALLLRSPRSKPVFYGLAALTILIGTTKLVQFLAGSTGGIDQLLWVNDVVRGGSAKPNRMAPNTAFAMASLGLGLIISRSPRSPVRAGSQALCMVSAATALAALVGYLLDVVALYQVHNYIAMALPTAAALFALSLAIISTNPKTGMMRILKDSGPAGSLARIALPLAFLVPIAVSVAGLSGQRAGYYGAEAAVAIALTANIIVNCVLLGGWAIALYRTDTERQQREALIARRENEYRRAERIGHVGYWKIEFPSKSVEWSPGFARICSIPEAASLDLGTALGIYHPEDSILAWKALQQAETAGTDWEFACRICRPDGSVRHVRSFGACERGTDGRTNHVFGVISDVTDLETARLDAEAAKAATASFLANMSHEIRTPLNGVMGFVELLMESDLDKGQRRHLALVQDSANALLKLLNDILDISKIEAGRLEIAKGTYNIHHGIQQCVRLMGPIAEQKRLDLTLAIGEDFPRHVVIDGLRLRQILLNLLGNAIKFTERGSVSVRVESQVRADEDPKFRICVEDTGIGIAPDRVASIFDDFVQAEETTTRRFGGSGLGLSISRKLVELMDGTIEVDSTPGRGTRMTVILPLVSIAATLPEPSSPPAARPAEDIDCKSVGRASVLLVEDVDINQELFADMIGRLGHRLDIACNGAVAVGYAKALLADPGKWDVILMDLQMPVMDGLTATKAIRALGGRAATIPIVALTASAFEEERRECELAGMNDHLAKPVGIEGIRQMINRWNEEISEPVPSDLRHSKNARLVAQFHERLRTSAERLVAIDAEMARADPTSVDSLAEEARTIAHMLAGSSGMFDMHELGDRAADAHEQLKGSVQMDGAAGTIIARRAIGLLIEALSASSVSDATAGSKAANG